MCLFPLYFIIVKDDSYQELNTIVSGMEQMNHKDYIMYMPLIKNNKWEWDVTLKCVKMSKYFNK